MPNSKTDPSINEKLADEIQHEWFFAIKRSPENLLAKLGIVKTTLIALELLLITSNHIRRLGLWEGFVLHSIHYRDGFNEIVLDKTGFDFTDIKSYHLWRGFVVPSLFGWFGYVIPALLCLRHELYHWKPELLKHYADAAAESRWGSMIPRSWLNSLFRIYEKKHVEHSSNTIQTDRQHTALKDSVEFAKVLRQVGINLFVSALAIFVMWMALLQTKVETRNILHLPRSYVPPVQGLIWYSINDLLYFYPHRIAHYSPGDSVPLPQAVTKFLHRQFKASHRLHHRCKANLGIAAWYCSPTEQILFNLFPALAGPVITQMFADAIGLEHIWGTHLVTLYVWIGAAAASSVLAHTGHRSMWNDPGQHDLHHEAAFDPRRACNFGTFGILDRLHGTMSSVPVEDAARWRGQRDRQAALHEAARRSKVPLTEEQSSVVEQPNHDQEWLRKDE